MEFCSLRKEQFLDIIVITLPERNGGDVAKKVYLVDTENVGAVWKHLFQLVANTDDIYLFYTENTPFLSYNDLEYILPYRERFTMIKCYTGNNALDFQLVSYLGFLMKTGAKTQYVIVSNDTGYDAMIHFWNDRERYISRLSQAELIHSVRQKEEKAAEKQKNKEMVGKDTESMEAESVETQVISLENIWQKAAEPELSDEEILIQGVLSDEKSREVIGWIVEMLHNYNMKHLQQIHRKMIKKYGQEQGGQMYKLIKPILKQFYQMQQIKPCKEEQNQIPEMEIMT